jgi:hypothetical protein
VGAHAVIGGTLGFIVDIVLVNIWAQSWPKSHTEE